MSKYAFKCRACGHLEDAGNAGERERPAACRSCGAGVSFDPSTGQKKYDDDNWIVLADLPKGELEPLLKRHGIEAKSIQRHKPLTAAKPDREPTAIDRSADETLGAEDMA